jgi:predicted lipoprotein
VSDGETSLRLFSCAGALVVVTLACSPVALGDGDKRVVVQQIASEVIVPTLEDLEHSSAELAHSCEALSDEPREDALRATQQAWRDARAYWKRTSAYGFGPAMDLRTEAAIDQFPVDPMLIELAIAGQQDDGDAGVTVADIDELGANRRGFHALEHLLFNEQGNAAVLELLSDDPGATRRLQFLKALAQHLEIQVVELRAAWTDGRSNYLDVLTDPGDDNDEYPTVKKVVDTLVNECVFLTEVIADTRLGKPLGVANAGEPQPELEESPLSDNSRQDVADSLKSVRDVYLGTRNGRLGQGITTLVRQRSPTTDRAVRDALDDALAATAAIPQPFSEAIVEHRQAVERAYDAVNVLKRVLGTEVVGALGAALKFNDNDGD